MKRTPTELSKGIITLRNLNINNLEETFRGCSPGTSSAEVFEPYQRPHRGDHCAALFAPRATPPRLALQLADACAQ